MLYKANLRLSLKINDRLLKEKCREVLDVTPFNCLHFARTFWRVSKINAMALVKTILFRRVNKQNYCMCFIEIIL